MGRLLHHSAMSCRRSIGTSLDGTMIESWDEERGFPGVLLRFHELPVWDRLLHAVTTPEAALFLVLLGIFGLIFEIYNPGIGIAALLGAVLLGLGFYALTVLATNWIALLLIVAGIAALVYDLHVSGFGVATGLGLVSARGRRGVALSRRRSGTRRRRVRHRGSTGLDVRVLRVSDDGCVAGSATPPDRRFGRDHRIDRGGSNGHRAGRHGPDERNVVAGPDDGDGHRRRSAGRGEGDRRTGATGGTAARRVSSG